MHALRIVGNPLKQRGIQPFVLMQGLQRSDGAPRRLYVDYTTSLSPPPPRKPRNRGSYDLTGRVYASGAMGVPLCLNVLTGDVGERVVYGDSEVRGLHAALCMLCAVVRAMAARHQRLAKP